MIIEPSEWIKVPDDNGDGFLLGYVTEGSLEFPIPIETHNVSVGDVKIGENQNFEIILKCAEKPTVFEDEDVFYKDKAHRMASESAIPIGTFSPSGEENYVRTPTVLMNGRVIKTYEDSVQYGFEKDDVLFSFSCLGVEYDAVLHGGTTDEVCIQEGNIVSCVYWVQGWPAEENNNESK